MLSVAPEIGFALLPLFQRELHRRSFPVLHFDQDAVGAKRRTCRRVVFQESNIDCGTARSRYRPGSARELPSSSTEFRSRGVNLPAAVDVYASIIPA
jgi:hypothetical protein